MVASTMVPVAMRMPRLPRYSLTTSSMVATRVYLAVGAVDLRKSFEGLYGMARDQMGCDRASSEGWRVQQEIKPDLTMKQRFDKLNKRYLTT